VSRHRRGMRARLAARGLALVAIVAIVACARGAAVSEGDTSPVDVVRPRFDVSSPRTSPFPSDWFTVADTSRATGRRVRLSLPADCGADAACEALRALEARDGFEPDARLSIPFDGEIDPATVRGNVVLVELPAEDGARRRGAASVACQDDEEDADSLDAARPVGRVTGVDRVRWDPARRTLHAQADAPLLEQARYALVVTRRVRDRAGNAVEPGEEYARHRSLLCVRGDAAAAFHRRQLVEAERAARRAGIPRREIAAMTVFHTRSAAAAP
jgi:hypothetical protein